MPHRRLIVFPTGRLRYRFGKLPTPHVHDYSCAVSNAQATVAVRAFVNKKQEELFGTTLSHKGIEPLFVAIKNTSQKSLSFSKSCVCAEYIASHEVAKKCARNPISGFASYWILGVIPFIWILFLPLLIIEAMAYPGLNRRIRKDFLGCEISDGFLEPGQSISGVLFLPLISDRTIYRIKLRDPKTKEEFAFNFSRQNVLGA